VELSVELPGSLPEVEERRASGCEDSSLFAVQEEVESEFEATASRARVENDANSDSRRFGVPSAAACCRTYLPTLPISQAIVTPIGHPALSQLAERPSCS
jgi:hypothetical protein